MRQEQHVEETAVVGGGPAGASAACLLSQAGRPVLLLERNSKPHHKVCGEFLSIEAQRYLARLGIDLDRLEASAISSVRVICNRIVAEADLPFIGRGLSRRSLDEELLKAAVSSGARLGRGVSVRCIMPTGAGWRMDLGATGSMSARSLFLATGKHDVRGVKRPMGRTRDALIGFKMHFVLASSQQTALDGAVEIVLFTGGYAGLQMIEGRTANFCLLVRQSCFEQVGKSWERLLEHICHQCRHMASRLDGAVATFPRPLAIFHIPYGFIHTSNPLEPEGLFRLGDQYAVIPSFTGDGMSIALHSGFLAASHYLRYGREGFRFHRQLQNDVRGPVRLASLFHEAGGWPVAQPALIRTFRVWPEAMQYVTELTRLREVTIQRALAMQ